MIRELLRTDMPALSKLYRVFWGTDSDCDEMERQFDVLNKNPAYLFLGYFSESGQLLGSVMGIVCGELFGDCKPFMLLENLAVDTEAQRMGIGKSLVSELERQAVEKGCRQVILVTEKSREDACRFYENIGYAKDNTGYKKKFKHDIDNS
ncbi:GNAT family N-acetyltransferase [Scatolibacter rhodanostii]|uniref:GNAT family N-acetyltransferase n=1 Tax=Scatolibacter rhodanostii TaxID=2014781 RepID=UPI001FA8271A|nr:GNAT family N-acetyltransferase [Scatolibacter rhodanostii]